MRTIELTTRFKRDYRRASKGQHGATLDASLRPVFDALVHDRPLDPHYRDHPLLRGVGSAVDLVAGGWPDSRGSPVLLAARSYVAVVGEAAFVDRR